MLLAFDFIAMWPDSFVPLYVCWTITRGVNLLMELDIGVGSRLFVVGLLDGRAQALSTSKDEIVRLSCAFITATELQSSPIPGGTASTTYIPDGRQQIKRLAGSHKPAPPRAVPSEKRPTATRMVGVQWWMSTTQCRHARGPALLLLAPLGNITGRSPSFPLVLRFGFPTWMC